MPLAIRDFVRQISRALPFCKNKKMKLNLLLLMSLLCTFANGTILLADVPEPLLRKLPVGVFVDSSVKVDANQIELIGQKLGGKILRLTNSKIRIHGQPIQVNVIEAADATSAEAIHGSLQKIKSEPFCLRKENIIVEYVGNNLDESVAIKTSYELGLIKKPVVARYKIEAELAPVEKADYMSCNPLFVEFLKLQANPDPETLKRIEELAEKFTFSKFLEFRFLAGAADQADYKFKPEPLLVGEGFDTIRYSFARTEQRHGVPFIRVTMEIAVNNTGYYWGSDTTHSVYLAETEFWPAHDAELIELAEKITAGKKTNDEKVQAILEWLTPGKNIKYAGQTGSRWGTEKVLQQKFGHCWDFSDCFVTLARAAGVPARQVAGWLYGSSGHVWAEYDSEKGGWQQVDPTGGGKLKCGIYHIPYFTTSDGNMPIVYLSMPKIKMLKE